MPSGAKRERNPRETNTLIACPWKLIFAVRVPWLSSPHLTLARGQELISLLDLQIVKGTEPSGLMEIQLLENHAIDKQGKGRLHLTCTQILFSFSFFPIFFAIAFHFFGNLSVSEAVSGLL